MSLRKLSPSSSLACACVLVAAGCASSSADGARDAEERFSSDQETLLDFALDGELITDDVPAIDPKKPILDQLLYTVGHLSPTNSVGRLGDVALTHVQSTPAATGKTTIRYHAEFAVAWGAKTDLPTTYTFRLPKDVSADGLKHFSDQYGSQCSDPDEQTSAEKSDWYFYRPDQHGCSIDAADVLTAVATVKRSRGNTSGKYPEYDLIWEDHELNIVAVFGKFDENNMSDDPGMFAHFRFTQGVKSRLRPGVTVDEAPIDPNITGPGTTIVEGGVSPDITISATLPNGRRVTVTSLLVRNVATAPAKFWQRYEELTPKADLIVYNAHAGLGVNVRAFDSHGAWVKGKYVIMFLNGCSTFAYGDGLVASARASLNPDDPTGTKYMDTIANAMPGNFATMDGVSLSALDALRGDDAPITYDQMFAKMEYDAPSWNSYLLVTGEEDNVFAPAHP